MYDFHSRLVEQSFYSELSKIAGVTPSEIVSSFRESQALRQAARPDLLQKLRPGTGSLVKAVGQRITGAVEGLRTSSKATRGLEEIMQGTRPGAAKNIHEENAALRTQGAVREAERQLHGPGLTGKEPGQQPKPSFFSGKPSASTSPTQHATLRNIAFGAGAGTVGVLGAQHYIKSKQQQQTYG